MLHGRGWRWWWRGRVAFMHPPSPLFRPSWPHHNQSISQLSHYQHWSNLHQHDNFQIEKKSLIDKLLMDTKIVWNSVCNNLGGARYPASIFANVVKTKVCTSDVVVVDRVPAWLWEVGWGTWLGGGPSLPWVTLPSQHNHLLYNFPLTLMSSTFSITCSIQRFSSMTPSLFLHCSYKSQSVPNRYPALPKEWTNWDPPAKMTRVQILCELSEEIFVEMAVITEP